MNFRRHLPSLPLRNKATKTDRDALQLRDNTGMHILYDGTAARTGQSLVEGRGNKQPCLEPVEYVTTCPSRRLPGKLTHVWQIVLLLCMAWMATLSPHGHIENHAWCGSKPYFLSLYQWVVSCPTVITPRSSGVEVPSIWWTMLAIFCPRFRWQELLRR